MRSVVAARALPDYRVDVTFDDGISGIVDLSQLAGKGVFHVWLDYHVFERVSIGADGELAWDGNIDICPDSLYLKVTGKTPEEMFPTLLHKHVHA